MRLTIAALLCSLLAACGKDEPPPPAPAPTQGREETRAIRNTEAIGVSGNAIADKVDGALDANDERRRKLQEAEARQTGEQPPPE